MSAIAPEATRYFRELERVAREGQGDVDGDGVADTFQQVLADGTVHWWTDDNGNGIPEMTSEESPSGDERTLYDSDEDGRPNLIETSSGGPPMRRVMLRDDDGDGHHENRETLVQETPGADVRVLIEEDRDRDGLYVVISDTVRPAALAHGASAATEPPCDRLAGFPASVSNPVKVVAEHRIKVPYIKEGTAGEAGRCTEPQAGRLVAAAECAIKKIDGCLKQANGDLSRRLRKALKLSSLTIGCSLSCGNYLAVTQSPARLAGGLELKMNFRAISPNGLDSVSDSDLCSVMLHETLHLTGSGGNSDHDEGTDQHYSCGRYCGGCTTFPRVASGPITPMQNCTRCAGTQQEKAHCGTEPRLDSIPCPTDFSSYLCHSGLGDPLGERCLDCKGYKLFACDETLLDDKDASLVCCDKCPVSSPDNDVPCLASTVPPFTSTCTEPPPHCR